MRVITIVILSAVAAVLVAAAPACDHSGSALKRNHPQVFGDTPSPGSAEVLPGRDTLFIDWFSNPPFDSGFHFVQVDKSRDTLGLFLRWIMGDHPHLRLLGPVGGINKANRKRLWGLHRIEIQNVGQIFSRAEDICTKGGNGTIENLELESIIETPDTVCWEQTWRFIKHDLSIRDTLDIVRRIMMRRGQPYFLVRYECTWVNSEPDSLRFLWHFQRQTRFGKRRSRHEVGFAPTYGMVTRRRAFDARRLGYLGAMMSVGNPLASIDTLADGMPSYLSDDLKEDFGSGVPRFSAGFIRFNPQHEIVPGEFAWIDTSGHYVPTLHADSLEIRVDTTNVFDGEERYFFARSGFVVFEPGETKTMEYAVGRALLREDPGDDLFPPLTPDIVWFDGSVSRAHTW
jgi:hypothetical protein